MQWIRADERQRPRSIGATVISEVVRDGCESCTFPVLAHLGCAGSRATKRECCCQKGSGCQSNHSPLVGDTWQTTHWKPSRLPAHLTAKSGCFTSNGIRVSMGRMGVQSLLSIGFPNGQQSSQSNCSVNFENMSQMCVKKTFQLIFNSNTRTHKK